MGKRKVCCPFSRKSDRKKRSVISGIWLCGLCEIKGEEGYMSIDEYLNPNNIIDWNKLNKEFDEMLAFNKRKIKTDEKTTV